MGFLRWAIKLKLENIKCALFSRNVEGKPHYWTEKKAVSKLCVNLEYLVKIKICLFYNQPLCV